MAIVYMINIYIYGSSFCRIRHILLVSINLKSYDKFPRAFFLYYIVKKDNVSIKKNFCFSIGHIKVIFILMHRYKNYLLVQFLFVMQT